MQVALDLESFHWILIKQLLFTILSKAFLVSLVYLQTDKIRDVNILQQFSSTNVKE